MNRQRQAAGFTLIELLIAMSLFVVLSTALIALLTQAFNFLSSGTEGSEVSDKTADFIRPFRADLENVVVERSLDPGVPQVRFLSDYLRWDCNGDRTPDMWAQRLVFVRSTVDETADPVHRQSGTTPDPKLHADGKDDAKEATEGLLRAPGGMQEVLLMAVPEDPKRPGILTLYRAVRSPPGGPGSLFDIKIRSIEDLRKIADPLLTDVLHFGVRFWTPSTTRWDGDFDRPSTGGPSLSWDSTRGRLPTGLRPNEFRLFNGKESLADPRDDVSPQQVRVTFVFLRTGRAESGAVLTEGIDASTRNIPVDRTGIATKSKEFRFLKVGMEWMSYSSSNPDGFRVTQRAVRGTVASSYKAGTPVRVGYTVERVIELPNYRVDWNFR